MITKKAKLCNDLVDSTEIEKALKLRPRSAYPIIKQINEQLLREGKIICPGKIPRDAFEKLLRSRKVQKRIL